MQIGWETPFDTHILRDVTFKSPLGFAVNKKEERATAASSPITHDERNADTLLILV